MQTMPPLDPHRFLSATKTAFHLFELLHNTLWQLYPDELMALSHETETELTRILSQALADNNISPNL